MVVGIYRVPDDMSLKRRCSEGSASLLPYGPRVKRVKNDADATPAIVEPFEAQEPSQGIVLLEDNGGIWHVDGLLELLAGALCATFGADPASLDMTPCSPDGAAATDLGSAAAAAEANAREDALTCNLTQPAQQHHQDSLTKTVSHQRCNDHRPGCGEPQPPQQRPSPTALTELNLRAHTESAARLRPASPFDDEDSSSVVSLSAWVVGSQSPRRRGSEGGVQQGLASGVAQLALGPAPPFSFPRRCNVAGGSALTGTDISPELRWPRRRLSVFARW